MGRIGAANRPAPGRRRATRGGRVFLVGDAAHLNPPWGGHGFNTGIGDAVNIGWKLAAVLAGWGGERLLASYEAERRPIAERTIREARLNMSTLAPDLAHPSLDATGQVGEHARRGAADAIRAAKDSEFHSLGFVLNYQYDDSPVIADDGASDESGARPGARLPHLWLPDGTSLYDRLGPGLSLLRLRDDSDPAPLIEAATTRGVPLDIVEVRGEALEERYGAPLILVRPDQHVAWRGTADPRTAGAIVDRACGV